MIGPSGAVKVIIAPKPVDFRKGAGGLAMQIKRDSAIDLNKKTHQCYIPMKTTSLAI